MNKKIAKLSLFALLVLLMPRGVAAASASAQGHQLQFNEDYALAADRAKVLEQLIPGSSDYYYYSCLERQGEADFAAAAKLLELWRERDSSDPRWKLIANRQALLSYSSDPAATYAYLKQELRLGFDHLRSLGDKARPLPNALDASLLARERLIENAFKQHADDLNGFRDSALGFLAAAELSDARLRILLERLQRPDLPGLVGLVLRDLGNQRSRGFGSLRIHRLLLLDQLEACARQRPTLLQEVEFVNTYLLRLRPGADLLWQEDSSVREAYLTRLQVFAMRLPSAQNSLKGHVLYHRLAHDLELGKADAALFLEYLRLPRNSGYSNADYWRKQKRAEQTLDFNLEFPTGLPRVGNDEPLVRSYLSRFFQDAGSYSAYAEYIDENYLRRLFAETKILSGQGDMERWYSLLDDAAYYEALKERVEIDFSAGQPRYYAADEQVALDLTLKNVGKLLIKVYEINSFNYYRDQEREVDASIDLDGLVAGSERSLTLEHSPFLRVPQRILLPELSAAGVYVVELIGNGLSSRAVIHKGRLQLRARNGAAGHMLRVLNEAGQELPKATVWFGGREYAAGENGEILLPYGAQGAQVELLLRHGQETTRARFMHATESYSLGAGFFVNREALIEGGSAQLLVRPDLSLNGAAISLQALGEVVLSITSIDQDGTPTTLEIPGFELHANEESVQTIQIAEGLAQLQVELRGTVQSLSTGKPVELKSPRREFYLNAIDAGLQTDCPLLGRNEMGYVIDVLGKNGEPKVARRLSLRLKLRDFSDDLQVQLETDARGRIQLGALPGVDALWVSGFPEWRLWNLDGDRRTLEARLHGQLGETLRVPYSGAASVSSRSAFSLIELRADEFAFDRFDALSLKAGYLELRGLTAGDYDLYLHESGQQVSISIGAGQRRVDELIGRDRHLQLAPAEMQITDMGVQGEELVIQLAGAQPDATLHVFGTRYVPAYDIYAALFARDGALPLAESVEHSWSSYHSGREISSEYRYILERRYAQHLPGNMLARPGLILNPWALDETASTVGFGGGAGGAFGGKSKRERSAEGLASRAGGNRVAAPGDPGVFPNLDFLAVSKGMQLNLHPDSNGVVRVPLSQLGPGALIHVLALDARSKIYRALTRADGGLIARDKRLRTGLDASQHLTQQQSIEFYDTGANVVVEDARNAKLKVYDSLRSVHELYSSLSGNPDLAEFDFLLSWPQLSAEEQRLEYSKHACHELNFFLHEKDPAFFNSLVAPYIANKAHKTFLDRYLLSEDLSAYLDAWAFAQLNTFERILLSKRVAGQSSSGQRLLREQLELIPSNPAHWARLFSTALRSGSLEQKSGLGLELERSQLAQTRAPSALTEDQMDSIASLGYGGGGGDDEDDLADGPLAAPQESQEMEVSAALLGRGQRDQKDDFDLRSEVRQLYRAPDPTRPYVENNYWHVTADNTLPGLVAPSAFWLDYALSDDAQPFASGRFVEAIGSFAEMILALAVLDLPFQPGEQQPEISGARLSMRAKGPLLLVSEEIKSAAEAVDALPVLVSQSFFRVDDRYRFDRDQRIDKQVTKEFLVGVAYGAQVVLTNPTSSPRQLELLLQIPSGAVPLQGGFRTRGRVLQLQPYATQTVDYHFYFPAPGQFSHYPVHVSRAGERIASAEPFRFHVVPEASEIDTSSWEHVSQDGSPEEVLAYLEQQNLLRVDLTRIAWRMRDKGFFERLIPRLRARHRFDETLWSYGIRHGDLEVTREYLGNLPRLIQSCGSYLDSALLSIDPVQRKLYQEIEFAPLINPRAHRFGKQREILDLGFAQQYESLLEMLCQRPKLDSSDWMMVTYYLLLQDRVAEAQASFARVKPAELHTRVQFDYMDAYMDFFSTEHSRARSIAEGYREYPVARWRQLFLEVLSQLDEAEGKTTGVNDPEDLGQRQAALALGEPALEVRVESQRVFLEHQNLERCEVNYYEMDIEFLFSTSPFVQQGSGSFAYIRPNRSDTISLEVARRETSFELPAEFRSSNVLVEVRAAGMLRRQAYYANSLSLSSFENYGQIKVNQSESKQPIAGVYVKVFARDAAGRVRFHKDGYTDLRGRFDYASLSGASDQPAQRFAILVLSENDGAIIREVSPPQR